MGKVFGVLAGVVLGVGLLVSAARVIAAPACGHRACSDEVAAAGLSGKARAACFKGVVAACKAGSCDCGGGPGTTGTCACSPSGAFLDGAD
jgi:hypothetical protein